MTNGLTAYCGKISSKRTTPIDTSQTAGKYIPARQSQDRLQILLE